MCHLKCSSSHILKSKKKQVRVSLIYLAHYIQNIISVCDQHKKVVDVFSLFFILRLKNLYCTIIAYLNSD